MSRELIKEVKLQIEMWGLSAPLWEWYGHQEEGRMEKRAPGRTCMDNRNMNGLRI